MDERMSMISKDLKRLEVLTDARERRLKQSKGARILDFFKQEDHYDFGSTLAHEYLAEKRGGD